MDFAPLRGHTRVMSDFGAELRRRREELGLSARGAADKAGFSEALWRQYENGYRAVTKDVRVPVFPSVKNCKAAAHVVEWAENEALALAGLPVPAGVSETIYEDGSRDTESFFVVRPVGLGLDDAADGLTSEQIDSVRAVIRAMKPTQERP